MPVTVYESTERKIRTCRRPSHHEGAVGGHAGVVQAVIAAAGAAHAKGIPVVVKFYFGGRHEEERRRRWAAVCGDEAQRGKPRRMPAPGAPLPAAGDDEIVAVP